MDYRTEVLKTFNKNLNQRDKLCNVALGIAGESGELADALKKHLFHGHPFDREKIINEAGDVLYYLEVLFDLIDATSDEVKVKNIKKLAARYPKGFNSQDSINRKD